MADLVQQIDKELIKREFETLGIGYIDFDNNDLFFIEEYVEDN